MSGSLGEEMCGRIREELATGIVRRPLEFPDRMLTPVFEVDVFSNGAKFPTLKQAKARLWTPWGCMWVEDL